MLGRSRVQPESRRGYTFPHFVVSLQFDVWWSVISFGLIWRLVLTDLTNAWGGSDGTNPSTTVYIRMSLRLVLLSSKVSISRLLLINVIAPGFLFL